jgi:hypothetical protein
VKGRRQHVIVELRRGEIPTGSQTSVRLTSERASSEQETSPFDRCAADISETESIVNLSCYDEKDECEVWAASDECIKNAVYMRSNCRESCKFCEPIIKVRPQKCRPRFTAAPVLCCNKITWYAEESILWQAHVDDNSSWGGVFPAYITALGC